MKGYALAAGQDLPGADRGVLASRESTNGALTIIDSETDGGAPAHVHTREDEFMYVLEGEITARCGDTDMHAAAGGCVFLPRGVPHAWDVVGARARVLIITAPGGLEAFLHEFHTSSDRAAVAARYGITLLRDTRG